MKENKEKYLFGTISHATLREEDLIPAFIMAIRYFDEKKATEVNEEYEKLREEDDIEQIDYFLNETLFDILNDFAPPYFYFGAHEGDGSDFGFWLCWERLKEDIESGEVLQVESIKNVPEEYEGSFVVGTGKYDSLSLYTRTNKINQKIWEN